MSEEASFAAPSGGAAQSIDVNDSAQVQTWSKKLSVSAEQIREAVEQVGSNASDVEEHLKGTRATTNAEVTKKAG